MRPDRNCGNCAFAVPAQEELQCRRHAPSPQLQGANPAHWSWMATHPELVCGDHMTEKERERPHAPILGEKCSSGEN